MEEIASILEIAITHQKEGRLDLAREIYEKILEIEPGNGDAHHLLGVMAMAEGWPDEAVARIAQAILLRPDQGDYHANMANARLALGQVDEAISHCRLALKIDPGLLAAHYNLGNGLFALGQVEEAIQAFETALDIDPTHQGAWTNLLFALNFSPEAGRAEVFQANRCWGRGVEERINAPTPEISVKFSKELDPDRRLRLAYFLPELETHVTARFLMPLLVLHDREGFEVLGYGYRTDGGQPPEALTEAVDKWHDVGGLGPAELAQKMRADTVDILLHPCSFKARYREVLAHRAAPLQGASTNLVSTTGLVAVDFLFTDEMIDPPGESEEFYTEQLLRLSGFNCYLPPADDLAVGPAPCLDRGHVTFGSFNNPAKLSAPTLAAWAHILDGAPEARLILKHRRFEDESARQAFRQRLGVAPERLEFRGFTDGAQAYLAQYDDLDMVLDPFPFGGGTTSYESIWMGVPVLTLAGESFMGRLSASLMSRVGREDFIATSEEDYVARALHLADDMERLGEIRASLRPAAQAGIFNAADHVSEMEAALRATWAHHCSKGSDRTPHPSG